jgi:hypothetical protein
MQRQELTRCILGQLQFLVAFNITGCGGLGQVRSGSGSGSAGVDVAQGILLFCQRPIHRSSSRSNSVATVLQRRQKPKGRLRIIHELQKQLRSVLVATDSGVGCSNKTNWNSL